MRLLVLFLCVACCIGADAQSRKKKNTHKTKAVSAEAAPVEKAAVPADTVSLDTLAKVKEEPKDRTDTIYYDKNWRVISNKIFATYYRYALYPADTLSTKYFKSFYMDGTMQSEGTFERLDKRDDKKSVFNGEFVSYYKGGAVMSRMFYSGGKPNGGKTVYYQNGNIKEHVNLTDGVYDGIFSSFSEDGIVCRLQEYKSGVADSFYIIVDKDGNYSKYDAKTDKPQLETPKEDEVQTEYKNGVAWPYYNKNGLIAGVSCYDVKEDIGKFRSVEVFLVNKSMINVDVDPAQIKVYSTKNGKRDEMELMTAEEYDNKVYKKKMKNEKRQLKKKAVVVIEREDNVSENLGAQVFKAGTSNTLKAFQEEIINLKTLVKGNKMHYEDRDRENLGYLERTTVHPGEVVSGFMLTSDKKVDTLTVEMTVSGIKYVYHWNFEKK